MIAGGYDDFSEASLARHIDQIDAADFREATGGKSRIRQHEGDEQLGRRDRRRSRTERDVSSDDQHPRRLHGGSRLWRPDPHVRQDGDRNGLQHLRRCGVHGDRDRQSRTKHPCVRWTPHCLMIRCSSLIPQAWTRCPLDRTPDHVEERASHPRPTVPPPAARLPSQADLGVARKRDCDPSRVGRIDGRSDGALGRHRGGGEATGAGGSLALRHAGRQRSEHRAAPTRLGSVGPYDRRRRRGFRA